MDLIGYVWILVSAALTCTHYVYEDHVKSFDLGIVILSLFVSWTTICAGVAIGVEFRDLILEYSRVQ